MSKVLKWALKAFGKRLRIGPADAARVAARDIGLLRFGLTGQAWKIYLDELVDGGQCASLIAHCAMHMREVKPRVV